VGLYAIALAIGVVGLGVPASTLLFAALVLACPLMMMFMMGGVRGAHRAADQPGEQRSPTSEGKERTPTTGR
jgi:hypothetical protein